MISKTGNELPIGFAMELASDLDAMDIFAEMSENDQQVWIDGARRMNTKDEMRRYVHSIADQMKQKKIINKSSIFNKIKSAAAGCSYVQVPAAGFISFARLFI